MKMAIYWCEKAAKSNEHEAWYQLYIMYSNYPTSDNIKKRAILHENCEDPFILRCFALRNENSELKQELLEKAINFGSDSSIYYLAKTYEHNNDMINYTKYLLICINKHNNIHKLSNLSKSDFETYIEYLQHKN